MHAWVTDTREALRQRRIEAISVARHRAVLVRGMWRRWRAAHAKRAEARQVWDGARQHYLVQYVSVMYDVTQSHVCQVAKGKHQSLAQVRAGAKATASA